jgi:hypothetical protein
MIWERSDLSEPCAAEVVAGANPPVDRESRRQVSVDVLATAIVDLLLKESSCVRGKHAATTR